MPNRKLVFRPNVEDGRSPAAQAVEQLIAGYRLELVARAEIPGHYARDFGAVPLADTAEGGEQTHHHLVAGEAIIDALTVATALYKGSTAEKLQMPGGIGEGEAGATVAQAVQGDDPVSTTTRNPGNVSGNPSVRIVL